MSPKSNPTSPRATRSRRNTSRSKSRDGLSTGKRTSSSSSLPTKSSTIPRGRKRQTSGVSAPPNESSPPHTNEEYQNTNALASPSPSPSTPVAPSKYRSFRIRFYSTVVLIASFLAIVYSGHVPLMFMVLAIQTVMVKELFQLARIAQEDRKIPGFRAQQWFFYFVAAFYVYVRFIKHNLMVEITSSAKFAKILGWILRRHTMMSFSLYTAGFVSFVLTLQKGAYTYQFSQYAWTHMILLVVFIPSSFFVSNIFDGIIWFLLPCALVIINDIAAYLAGFFFGRTPLIKLSPKKTWEGFLGGILGTVFASWYLAAIMSQSAWLTCPRSDLSIFKPMECSVPPRTFQLREFSLQDIIDMVPESTPGMMVHILSKIPFVVSWNILEYLSNITITASPMQFHAIALAVFASAIAPFGGFFASGFKRGMGIKDFGHSIPGHGGMTDRMDCQIVMAAFSYIYYHTFVDPIKAMTVGAALSTVMKLTVNDRLELFEHLTNVLVSEEMVPQSIADSIRNLTLVG